MQHSRNRFESGVPDPQELADRIIQAFKDSTDHMRVTVIDGDEHRPTRIETFLQMKHPVSDVEIALKLKEVIEGEDHGS